MPARRAERTAEAAAGPRARTCPNVRRRPPPPVPPSAGAQSSADQNLAEMAQRLEAALRRPAGDSPSEPGRRAAGAPEPPPPRRTAQRASRRRPAPQKSGFENLEDEMASLLGRPKNPS
jgi:flagellar protein FliO/FliZ